MYLCLGITGAKAEWLSLRHILCIAALCFWSNAKFSFPSFIKKKLIGYLQLNGHCFSDYHGCGRALRKLEITSKIIFLCFPSIWWMIKIWLYKVCAVGKLQEHPSSQSGTSFLAANDELAHINWIIWFDKLGNSSSDWFYFQHCKWLSITTSRTAKIITGWCMHWFYSINKGKTVTMKAIFTYKELKPLLVLV